MSLYEENVSVVATNINISAENVYGDNKYIKMVILITSIVVPIIFVMIFCIGVVGNFLLVYIVLRNRVMRSNPNLFLTSLAVGDFLLLLISIPFTATIYTLPEWNYGEPMCKVNEFMQTLSLGVSIFTLTAVTGDRFIAVVFPIRSYKWSTMRRTLQICAVLWVFSIVLAVPDLFSAHVGPYQNINGSFLVCKLEWSDSHHNFRPLFRFVVYFVIPMLIISIMYTIIAKTLLQKPLEPCPEGHMSSAAWAKQTQVRKKVSKVVLCIVVIFAVCWIPRYVFTLCYHYGDCGYNTLVHIFKISGFCLSFAYSSVNPVALYFISDDFRQFFDHYLFGCCCKSRRLKKRRGTCILDNTAVGHSMISNGGRLGGSHTILSFTPGHTPNMSLEDITRA